MSVSCAHHMWYNSRCTFCQMANQQANLLSVMEAESAAAAQHVAALTEETRRIQLTNLDEGRRLRFLQYLETAHGERYLRWHSETETYLNRLSGITERWNAIWNERLRVALDRWTDQENAKLGRVPVFDIFILGASLLVTLVSWVLIMWLKSIAFGPGGNRFTDTRLVLAVIIFFVWMFTGLPLFVQSMLRPRSRRREYLRNGAQNFAHETYGISIEAGSGGFTLRTTPWENNFDLQKELARFDAFVDRAPVTLPQERELPSMVGSAIPRRVCEKFPQPVNELLIASRVELGMPYEGPEYATPPIPQVTDTVITHQAPPRIN